MAKIPGTIPLGGTIAPTDSEDVYATHIANYGQGGVHHADTIAERDAITAERRVEGMLCTVADGGSGNPVIYQLVGGTDNANWKELETGGGGPLDVSEVCGGFRRIPNFTVPAQTTTALTIPLTATYSTLVNNDLFQLQNEGGGVIIKKEGNFLLSYTLEVRNGVMGDLYESYIYQDGGWIVRQQTQMSVNSFTMQDSCVIHAREGNVITLRMRNEGSSDITVTVTGLWIICTGVRGPEGPQGPPGEAAGGLMTVISEGSTDITSSMTNMGSPELRKSVGDYFTWDGANIVAAKPCYAYVFATLNSVPQESGFADAANFRISIKQYDAAKNKTSIISEARNVILRWEAHTVQFGTQTIVKLAIGDKLFCQCAQYAAYAGDTVPTRRNASMEMGVFVLMPDTSA